MTWSNIPFTHFAEISGAPPVCVKLTCIGTQLATGSTGIALYGDIHASERHQNAVLNNKPQNLLSILLNVSISTAMKGNKKHLFQIHRDECLMV